MVLAYRLYLLHCDAPAQVNIHQFHKAVVQPSAQSSEHPLNQQVRLLAEVAEGAGEEEADGAGGFHSSGKIQP